MKPNISKGIWPTMVTPFTESNEIDYEATERLIEWFILNQVDGLFAVCQSSEMFFLTLEERVKLAAFVKEKAAGRVPVIASGHISDDFEDQIKELNAMADTGIDALVLITNRLALEGESDEVWKRNLESLLKQIPADIALGFYECPHPYKRLISPELLKWCAGTGRFLFLKDTSCDVDNMKGKLEAVQDGGLQIYNANTATLLETLKLGITGYSGIMANFHPDLYVWLQRNWLVKQEEAAQLVDFLSMASFIEKQLYPVNAKYYLMLEGILDNYHCRSKNHDGFTATNRLEVEQLYRLSKSLSEQYRI
ncbi:dihydrodipicolinate synthase family protein [Paenibacillus radicis (ex Xue et al. 2023)]|uniref:Dihydrodipicolinate synthase family protein n=1 Tax=Paenibacillus radicis (ex Xue et al. 2023) TaxID=2972489 RepID=A0ABT1YBP0_9BACL|nr:dihydrodipicolinate synthase family protein [Paenibacillus radicis (ex Xue et al. 2023)]MCR8629653.1 dihydrodipicolinate synthase family protein [Paenibacillus radicis (ex Xue et al. 2023)]